MAIVWAKQLAGKHYEVRRAGRSTRLYTDGVFHTQYNPSWPITRGVWDLLMLPAFFNDVSSIKRVLVLGAGGGAVIHLLDRYIKPNEIIAVDLDPVHLSIARRFFDIKPGMATLVNADAVEWLRSYKGPTFDMIIDDLFAEGQSDDESEGVRAVSLTKSWFNLLDRHLSKNGVLVMNVFSSKELRQSAYFTDAAIAKKFLSAFSLRLPRYENIIAAFLKKKSSPMKLRKNISNIAGLNARAGLNKLDIRVNTMLVKPFGEILGKKNRR